MRCSDRILESEIQDIAVKAGTIVLENGGETYRTEETVVKIARSLGAADASAFVTPTVVILSFSGEDGVKHTFMNRIFSRASNLRKVALVNDLSRRLEKRGKTSNPRQVKFLLHRIDSSPVYPAWSLLLAGSLTSMFFTLMFGGSLFDAAIAFFSGFLLKASLLFLEKVRMNGFLVSLISGAVVSIVVDFISVSNLPVDSSVIMTGTLMQVVPGLALVNSIRDIISGDLVSGTARLVEALMIAAGLSVGAVSGLFLTGFL